VKRILLAAIVTLVVTPLHANDDFYIPPRVKSYGPPPDVKDHLKELCKADRQQCENVRGSDGEIYSMTPMEICELYSGECNARARRG
jgi:hypothetical protein